MGSPYQSQSAVNYNSSPPPDDGTTVAANKITWAKIKSALADSVKTLSDAINTQLRTSLNVTPSTTSSTYSTLVGDHLTTIEATGTISIHLGAAATMIAQTMGYTVTVYNKGTGTVTCDLASATDTLAGQVNGAVTLAPGQAMTFTVAQSGVGYDIVSATGFAPFVLTGAAGTNTATAAAPANLIGLYSGLIVSWTPANINTGALTLNITPSGGSALTAKNVFSDGSACVGGEAKASSPILLQYDGTQFNILGRRFFKQPTRQQFTSGSGTYTTPSGATRIYVRLVGAGGGGAGSGTTPGAAAAGGNTTFSTLTGTGGGAGGAANGALGTGGGASGGDTNLTGGDGGGQQNVANTAGNSGGVSFFGGNGPATYSAAIAGNAAKANTGSGGSGAGCGATVGPGGGGGAGGYVEKTFTAPAATYSYGVGASGAGGTLGTSGGAGGAGAAGIIIVDEFYD